jgi:hypothetical protein
MGQLFVGETLSIESRIAEVAMADTQVLDSEKGGGFLQVFVVGLHSAIKSSHIN